jgi:hypothetical protein
MALSGRYPRLAMFRDDQDFAGAIIAQPEPGYGFIVYIPAFEGGSPLYNVELYERVTVTNLQVVPFNGTVTLSSTLDPTAVIPV